MAARPTRPAVTHSVMNTELTVQRPSWMSTWESTIPKSSFHASSVNGSGTSESGSASASLSVLNEVASVIRNGPM